MPDRGVGANHQIKIADHGGGVDERPGRCIQPIGEVQHRKIDCGDLLRPGSFLQADQPHVRQTGQRCKRAQRHRSPTIRGKTGRPLPGDPDLETLDRRQLLAPLFRQYRIDHQVGDFAGNRFGAGSEGRGATEQRKIIVAVQRRRVGRTAHEHFVEIGLQAEQRAERRFASQHHASRRGLLEQPGVADELQRIAHALLGNQRQAAAFQGLARPARKIRQRPGAGQTQPGFVSRPAPSIISLDQVARRQTYLRAGQVGSNIQRLLVMGLGPIEIAVGHQQIAQVVVRFDVVRFVGQGLVEVGAGLRKIVLLGQDDSQIVVRFGMIGQQSQDSLEAGRGFGGLPLFPEDAAQIVVCVGVVGPQSQDLLESGRCFVELPLAQQHPTQLAEPPRDDWAAGPARARAWRAPPAACFGPATARRGDRSLRRSRAAARWHARSGGPLDWVDLGEQESCPGCCGLRRNGAARPALAETAPRLRRSSPAERGWLRDCCASRQNRGDAQDFSTGRGGLAEPAGSVFALGKSDQCAEFGLLAGRPAGCGHRDLPIRLETGAIVTAPLGPRLARTGLTMPRSGGPRRRRRCARKRRTTWPSTDWRNSRIVGYQGESSRPESQRHSPEKCRISEYSLRHSAG